MLDTGRGVLVVRCQGVENYLDGHRIKLQIGNPLLMEFVGFKLTFRFGTRPPPIPDDQNLSQTDQEKSFKMWKKAHYEWNASLRRSEISFTDALRPGMWNTVEAILPQTKAEDIAYIDVAIETKSISLGK